MSHQPNRIYEFGPYRLDAAERLLWRDGETIPLQPKIFDLLLVLVAHHGHLLEKDVLMKEVWPDTVVEEANLANNISILRKTLGEDGQQFIETIPKHGYRFVASLKDSAIGPAIGPAIGNDGWAASKRNGSDHVAVEETAGNSLAGSLFNHIVRYKAIAAISLVVIPIGLILSRPYVLNPFNSPPAQPFQKTESIAITRTGNVNGLAISPDGRYIVYGLIEAGRESLWLRNAATDSVQQIVPLADVHYYGLSFSRDGDHLYFVRAENPDPVRLLYRIPILGGVATRLLSDLDWVPGISPDDTHIVFHRLSLSSEESYLMVANADGSGEYKLAARAMSDRFRSHAWSPDGKVILTIVGRAELSGAQLRWIAVQVADGAERALPGGKWRGLGSPVWLPDGSGFVAPAASTPGASGLWHFSWPDGAARKITDDPNIVGNLSLTADSGALLLSTVRLQTNIWTARAPNLPPRASANRALPLTESSQQITTGIGDYHYVGWLPDDGILFTASAGNIMRWDLWRMNADGTGRKQLTTDAGNHGENAVSPDGRYIVFSSDRSGINNIWRMDSDGGNPRQLTNGSGEKFPACSSDGKWTVYTSLDDWTLWKAPIDGGESIQVTQSQARGAAISPNGKWIAYFSREPQPGGIHRYRIVLIPFAGGPPVRTFDLPKRDSHELLLRWTPDGQAVTYIIERGGVSNIWRQPIAGGRPVQLTDFKSDNIFDFGWSSDGAQLVCTRGLWATDVFMLKSLK